MGIFQRIKIKSNIVTKRWKKPYSNITQTKRL